MTQELVFPAHLRAFALALPFPGMLFPLDSHLAYSLTFLGSLLECYIASENFLDHFI